jgi:hypothetical protein
LASIHPNLIRGFRGNLFSHDTYFSKRCLSLILATAGAIIASHRCLPRMAKLRKALFTAEGKPHLSRGKMAHSAQH